MDACLKESDTALIMTNWPEFTNEITPETLAGTSCKLMIDCWRTLDQTKFTKDCKVLYLGQGLTAEEQKLDELATAH